MEKNDKQLLHHLWWLKKYLNNYFADDYKELMQGDYELSSDVIQELDALLAYIKQNY